MSTAFKLLQSSRSMPLCYQRSQMIKPLIYTCVQCDKLQHQQVRGYQKPAEKPGLFSRFFDNIKEGMKRDKQMQENLEKFKEEAKKFEESDAIKDAKSRLTFMHKVKENISPYVEKVEQTVQDSQKTFEKVYKDAKESDIYKKSQKVSEELGKTAKETAEKISKTTEGVEDTQSYKTASQAFSAVREDLFDDIAKESRPYQRPEKLRRRSNENEKAKEAKQFEANEDAQDVVLHKDSKWQQQWKDFRDNNPVVTGLFSLKTKYDESDNVMVRATRVVTDKLQDVFMDVFSQSEQAQTLTEISKIDPSFNKENFLKECEFEIIPTVLEAFLRGDLDILQDWCHEGAFSILSQNVKQTQQMGLVNASRILDIRDVDLALAKIMDQGPVLILTFQAQQVSMLTDKKGKVIEGAVDNIENVNYVWAMCRDQSIFDHRSAWRVLEFGIVKSEAYV